MNLSSVKIILVKVYRVLYNSLTSVYDYFILLLDLPFGNFLKNQMFDERTIIYLGGGTVPRISRLAKWVKRVEGFNTVLVVNRLGFTEHFSNEDWGLVMLYRNKFHLLRILKQFNKVYLIHAYAPSSNYPCFALKNVKAPFIIDMQDVYACYYGLKPNVRWLKKELPREKYCLEHSGGIIAHGLEANVAYRKYNMEKPASLFFPIYCDNDSFLDNRKELKPDNIHFVYAGGVAGSHRDKFQYGSIQFHELIRTLSSQQIHFHIYPSPTNLQGDIDDYIAISKTNEYFHFHPSVSNEKLSSELNKYHFGLIPFFLKNTGQSEEKYKYATTLKLFNYFEAGIPVIVSEDLIYQNWIVRRYKAGITIKQDDLTRLKEIVSATNYASLVGDLLRNRDQISLKKHIPRLTKFYGKLALPQ